MLLDDWGTAPLPMPASIALRKPNVKQRDTDAVRLLVVRKDVEID